MLRLTKSVKTYVSLANKMPTRRFPPPWTVEDFDAWFVVKDNGQKLVYEYFEEERWRRSAA